jgi:hypothetical protein
MPNPSSRISVAGVLLVCAAALVARAQDNLPDRLRASPTWAPGEKQTYQVQQSLRERAAGKEDLKFLSNGTLEIAAVQSTSDTLTFTWHRRMENAELELAREPWGIRGNAPYEKLVTSLVRDGLPLTVKLDLRTQRARIESREALEATLSRRLQSVGGELTGSATSRSRTRTPDERNMQDTSNAAAGIAQPLVRHDTTSYANTPRNGRALAAWYAQLATAEIEDFLGVYGRELQLDKGNPPAGDSIRTYRPTAPGEVLVTLVNAPARPEVVIESRDADDGDGEVRSMGLAGGPMVPVAYDAKIELTLPSGWPKRAAIVRTEGEGGGESKRTTQRRVYLRQ